MWWCVCVCVCGVVLPGCGRHSDASLSWWVLVLSHKLDCAAAALRDRSVVLQHKQQTAGNICWSIIDQTYTINGQRSSHALFIPLWSVCLMKRNWACSEFALCVLHQNLWTFFKDSWVKWHKNENFRAVVPPCISVWAASALHASVSRQRYAPPVRFNYWKLPDFFWIQKHLSFVPVNTERVSCGTKYKKNLFSVKRKKLSHRIYHSSHTVTLIHCAC